MKCIICNKSIFCNYCTLSGKEENSLVFYENPAEYPAIMAGINAVKNFLSISEKIRQHRWCSYHINCKKRQSPYQLVGILTEKSKRGKWVFFTAAPLRDAEGKITGAIESLQDITTQKRAEEILRESRQQYADIINFLPDATFAVDLKGKVVAWNRSWFCHCLWYRKESWWLYNVLQRTRYGYNFQDIFSCFRSRKYRAY